MAVCFQDITVLKRLEACRNDHCALLERVASDAPIAELLLQSVELMESFHPSSKASILLLDEERRHIRVAAAPSIPSAFTKTVEGLEITSQSVAWGMPSEMAR